MNDKEMAAAVERLVENGYAFGSAVRAVVALAKAQARVNAMLGGTLAHKTGEFKPAW